MCKINPRSFLLPRRTAPAWSLLLAISIFMAPTVSAQPSDSLMLHLEFEGDVLDSSGNMCHGTVGPNQPLSFVPGVIGMAASFSGAEQILFQDFSDSNFSTGNFSLTYWFNTPIDRAAA